jgi:RNA polymerase sigma-70 factor (ECF subfamily)
MIHEIGGLPDYIWELQDNSQKSDQNLLYKELISQVKNLPTSYRVAFNMYVIDGFSHQEIAEKLDISVGTSKSNLAKARMQLKKILDKDNREADICSL